MKIYPKKALEFLQRFEYDRLTVSAIQEQGAPLKAFNLPDFKSTKYAAGGNPKVAATIETEDITEPAFLKQLIELQKLKRAIYFLVNESDGYTCPQYPNATRNINMESLTACFGDTDNCPVKYFTKWLNKIGIAPHMVVETSPKKYHFYFLINHVEAKPNQRKWKAIQQAISWLGNRDIDRGMDKTMHDTTQLMRIPGFIHQKEEPFNIRLVKENFHEKYDLEELFEATGAADYYQGEDEQRRYQYPTEKVTAGERHASFRSYALSLANDLIGDPLAYNKLVDGVDGFMLKNFEKPYTFLQGGHRRKEVIRTIKDCMTLAENKIITDLPDIDMEELDDFEDDKFAISPTFYYNAPGIIGELVKHISTRARYPIPSFTFASVLSLMGTLKSNYVTSELGHAPANYFLCLAPTGTGKNYPQEVLSHTLNRLGIPNLAASKIRSAIGIERFLEKHQSMGTLTLDEAENFLSSLNGANGTTPHYLNACKDVLLELYSKTNTPYYCSGYVGDKKTKPIILNYPRLNLIAYGVVHTLHQAFDAKSIQDGLLQRFIIMTHMKGRKRNPNFQPAGALNGNFLSELQEILIDARIKTVEDSFLINDLTEQVNSTDCPKEREKLKKRLQKVKSKKEEVDKQVITFDVDALDLLDKFSDKMDDMHDREVSRSSGIEGLFTRAAEQVGRLAVTMTPHDSIDKELVQYLIDFIESRVFALVHYAKESMGRSAFTQSKDQVLNTIIRRYKDSLQPVTYRYTARHTPQIANRRAMRDIIDALYDDGRLRMVTPTSRGGRGKTGETFVPISPLEDEL